MKNFKRITAIAAAAVLSMNMSICQVSADWVKTDDAVYYTTSSGKKVTGLKKIDGKKYYFSKNGEMKTGWVKIKGEKYYFGSDGAMKTGNVVIGDKIYKFASSGKLVEQCKNTLVRVNGKVYYVNKKGKITKGFQKVGTNYYYFGTQGYAIDKEYEKDGYIYVLDADKGLLEKNKVKVKPEDIKIKEGPFVNTAVKLIEFEAYNDPNGDRVYFNGAVKNTASGDKSVKVKIKMSFLDENGRQIASTSFTTTYLALSDMYEFEGYESVTAPVYKVNFTVSLV